MPFNDNLPAENTDPWYAPLTTAWTNLKAFVNGLETALGDKSDVGHTHAAADVTSGTFTQTRIPDLNASKTTTGVFDVARIPALPITGVTGLQAELDSKPEALNGLAAVWLGTQVEYDAIATKDPATLYFIQG